MQFSQNHVCWYYFSWLSWKECYPSTTIISRAEKESIQYPSSVDSSGTNTNKVLILLVVAFTFAITYVFFLNDNRRMGMGGNHNIPKIQDVTNNWLSSSGFIEYRGYKDITSSSSSATPLEQLPSCSQEVFLESIKDMNATSVKLVDRHNRALRITRPDPPNNLLYINIPKSGSTFMGSSLRAESKRYNSVEEEDTIASIEYTINLADFNTSEYTTFTMLRSPHERLISAYSTIMTRYHGIVGTCTFVPQRKTINVGSPPAPNTNNTTQWKSHFTSAIDTWLQSFHKYGFNNPNCKWNEHIIPQLEFIKGSDLKYIGCTETAHDTLTALNISYNSSSSVDNSYERSIWMPVEKFQSYDLLTSNAKKLLDEVYAEDYVAHRCFCT